MELFGFDRLTVSEWALREGIVLDAIPRHEAADWSGDPRAIRASSVLQLARRCNWDEGHSRQTARLALDLFDQTTSLHGLAAGDRELLEHASLLHDIGEHVSTESHHKHSAYLIQHGKLRGFTPEEVDFVAALARAHRGGGPKPSHEPFASLDREARDRVTRLAALLRVADGLDRGRAGNVDGIEVVLNGSRGPARRQGRRRHRHRTVGRPPQARAVRAPVPAPPRRRAGLAPRAIVLGRSDRQSALETSRGARAQGARSPRPVLRLPGPATTFINLC